MPASVPPVCPVRRERGSHPRSCGPVHQIAAARLAPARISIAAAAARVIHVSGMTLRKLLPTAIAIAATGPQCQH